MDFREKYTGNKEEFYFFLKDEVIKLFKEKLVVEGEHVSIPDDEELDYEIKFVGDENYGDLSIKVKWGEKPKENLFEDNSLDVEDTSKQVIDKLFDFE